MGERQKGRKATKLTTATGLQHKDISIHANLAAEKEHFSEDHRHVLEDKVDMDELGEMSEEDLDTDQILALAKTEEAKCKSLQEEMESRKRLEEEELIRLEQECQEALQ